MRYEIKYIFPATYLDGVLRSVQCSPYMFREIYDERQVNNIYLDTLGLADYHDSVNGASSRSKTRIRWYGSLWQHADAPVLEVKYKIGMSGEKKSRTLPGMTFDESFLWQGYADLIDDKDQMIGQMIDTEEKGFRTARLREKVPSIINTYKRRYFATPDGLCRITVDRDMRFYSPMSAVMHERFFSADRNIILEIKFEEADLQIIASYVRSLGYRVAKNSKYVNGVNAVYYGGLSL